MCEERSLAFWLVDQGYDVWLTNIRANYGAGHTEFSRDDPRFWAWGLKELAFDLRDVVEFVCEATAHAKVAYVGHSQGSGSMYVALSPGICPELGDRLSVFVALGPSVYSGPVLRRFPFSLLRKFRSRKWWSLVFGVKVRPSLFDTLRGHVLILLSLKTGLRPRHRPLQDLPADLHLWPSRLCHLFVHVPVPHALDSQTSDPQGLPQSPRQYFQRASLLGEYKLIFPLMKSCSLCARTSLQYMAAWAARGCIFDPRIQEPWFPRSFPPHSVYYGNIDQLVLGKPLAQRLQQNEKNIDIIHCVELDGYEHLDFM
jgi:lysosomal acid lipase/cholesteryl ester hydrolase